MATNDPVLYRLLREGFVLVDQFSARLGAELRAIVAALPTGANVRAWIAARIDGVLNRAYGLTQKAALVSDLFRTILSSTDRGALAPFDALWSRLERAVERKGKGLWGAIKGAILREGPESSDPLARTLARYERDRDAFARSGRLDANRRWVEGDGTRYRLSDRIWRQGRRVRRQIIATIQDGINAGDAPDVIAKRVERYVVRGKEGQAARHARLLVQAETAHVYHEAEAQAAKVAPDVAGLRWVLSPGHSYSDPCDGYADADNHGLGPGGYPPNAVPLMPHPRCACQRALIFREELQVGDYLVERYGGTA